MYKAENEELKERIDDLDQELYMAIDEGRAWIEKYEQALKEIKEIAELACEQSVCDRNHCYYCSDGRIMKICEVIDETTQR